MLPILFALAQGVASPGPSLPPVRGLVKPMDQGADARDYVRWSLREMGQAVVVVEGQMGLPLPTVATGIRVFDGNLRLFKPRLPQPGEIPAPAAMDLSTIMAGGNVVQRSYPLGWGY